MTQAGPDDARQVLESLWATRHNVKDATWFTWCNTDELRRRAFTFRAMLDCGAYLSAAEMLVPYHLDDDGEPTTQMKWSLSPGFGSAFKIGNVSYENLQKTDAEYQGEWFWCAKVFGFDGRAKDPALALCAAISAALGEG